MLGALPEGETTTPLLAAEVNLKCNGFSLKTGFGAAFELTEQIFWAVLPDSAGLTVALTDRPALLCQSWSPRKQDSKCSEHS